MQLNKMQIAVLDKLLTEVETKRKDLKKDLLDILGGRDPLKRDFTVEAQKLLNVPQFAPDPWWTKTDWCCFHFAGSRLRKELKRAYKSALKPVTFAEIKKYQEDHPGIEALESEVYYDAAQEAIRMEEQGPKTGDTLSLESLRNNKCLLLYSIIRFLETMLAKESLTSEDFAKMRLLVGRLIVNNVSFVIDGLGDSFPLFNYLIDEKQASVLFDNLVKQYEGLLPKNPQPIAHELNKYITLLQQGIEPTPGAVARLTKAKAAEAAELSAARAGAKVFMDATGVGVAGSDLLADGAAVEELTLELVEPKGKSVTDIAPTLKKEAKSHPITNIFIEKACTYFEMLGHKFSSAASGVTVPETRDWDTVAACGITVKTFWDAGPIKEFLGHFGAVRADTKPASLRNVEIDALQIFNATHSGKFVLNSSILGLPEKIEQGGEKCSKHPFFHSWFYQTVTNLIKNLFDTGRIGAEYEIDKEKLAKMEGIIKEIEPRTKQQSIFSNTPESSPGLVPARKP